MKSKKIYSKVVYRLFILFIAAILSCDGDFLEVKNENRLSSDNFWKNGDDVKSAVIGAYSPLSNVYAWGRMMILHTVYRSDVVNPVANFGVITDASNFSIDPGFERLLEIWGSFWKTIFRSNMILQNISTVKDPNFSDREREILAGEAKFLRAFQYFYLITMFRNIPLLKKPANNLKEVFQSAAPPEDVWQFIIEDLKDAQSKLPKKWDEDNLGRATWGAATGLLGKVYLYRSGIENVDEYAQAIQEFEKIISSGIYDLMPSYTDNFTNAKENNKESLFEIQFDNKIGSWGADVPNTMKTAAFEPDLAPPGFTSQKGLTVNKWALDLFLKESTKTGKTDPRASATLLFNEPGAMIYNKSFQEAFSDNLNFICVRKYLDFETENKITSDFGFSGFPSSINWRIMRFADILLLYAEAENEKNGPSAKVYEAIHRVRRRVDMPDLPSGLNKVQMRDKIRDERVLELSIEGDRYFDLLRWGMIPGRFVNNPKLRSKTGGVFYQKGREYLPIPQAEVDTNPDYKQNPGY